MQVCQPPPAAVSLQPRDLAQQQQQLRLVNLLSAAWQHAPSSDDTGSQTHLEQLLRVICRAPAGAEMPVLGLLTCLTQPSLLQPLLQVNAAVYCCESLAYASLSLRAC